MAKVVIGAWDDLVVDNRGKRFFEIDEFTELGDFREFDPGNRIKAFLGGARFLRLRSGGLRDRGHPRLPEEGRRRKLR